MEPNTNDQFLEDSRTEQQQQQQQQQLQQLHNNNYINNKFNFKTKSFLVP